MRNSDLVGFHNKNDQAS